MKALMMAGSALRRLARDRLALFFLVLLPVVIIAVIGITFGDAASERLPVGIADEGAGPLGDQLRADLEASPALDPRAYDDPDALRKAVRRGVVSAGVVLPAGYDQALRAGRPAEVTFVVDQTRPAPAPVRTAVSAVVTRQAAEVKAARFAAEQAGVGFDTALARARALADGQEQVRVEATTIGGREDALPTGFNYTAPANLVLFVFITSLAGAAGLIEARRLGVIRRMVAVTTSLTKAAGTCRKAPARVPSSISSRTRRAAVKVFCSYISAAGRKAATSSRKARLAGRSASATASR